MPKYEVYLITNKLNNKRYVGQVISSRGYLKRYNEHVYESLHTPTNSCKVNHSKTYLHKAIKKYGVENFEIKLIEDNIDENNIDARESYWISYYDSFIKNGGYNMTTGGQGMHNYKFDEKTLENISQKVKSYWKDLKENHKDDYDKWCQHLSDINKGRVRSEETKDKLSEYAKQRVGKLNPFYGREHNDNTKKAISESNSKRVGMFSLNNVLLKEFSSIHEATNYLMENNITTNKNASSRISKICRGIDKTAYGYIWKFL